MNFKDLVKTNMGKIGEKVKPAEIKKTTDLSKKIDLQLNALPLKYNRAIFRHPVNFEMFFIADKNRATATGEKDDKGRELYTVSGFYAKNGELMKCYIYRQNESEITETVDINAGEILQAVEELSMPENETEPQPETEIKKKRGRKPKADN